MATPFNPLTDFTKMLEKFNFPGVDSTSITESRRKDMEALTEANRLAYERDAGVGEKTDRAPQCERNGY